MITRTRTTWVWGDSVGRQVKCKDPRCGQWITWAENVRTGKRMCFDGTLVALKTATMLDGRQQWEVDLDTNHFATCPGADRFRRHGART